jgi:hypothetical protein
MINCPRVHFEAHIALMRTPVTGTSRGSFLTSMRSGGPIERIGNLEEASHFGLSQRTTDTTQSPAVTAMWRFSPVSGLFLTLCPHDCLVVHYPRFSLEAWPGAETRHILTRNCSTST